MKQIDYSKIDKDKFRQLLWRSLHDMAFLDIKRASDGKSKMGAFILASCFIEYLAGFRYGKETTGHDYKNFVRNYMDYYSPDKLYKDLRCKLVHNYSEGGSYTFVDDRRDLHFKKTQDKKQILNLENFISDIEAALHTYFIEFDEEEKNGPLFKLAVDRLFKIGILGINQTFILKH